MSAPSDVEWRIWFKEAASNVTLDPWGDSAKANIELGPGKTDISGIWTRANILDTKRCGGSAVREFFTTRVQGEFPKLATDA